MESRELNRPRRPCQRTGWLLVLAALLSAHPAAARLLDRVVALVDGRVLSWSQLDFEARVMLIDRGGVEAATAPLDAATIQSALDLAIAQRAATAEADKLNAYPVEPAEIDQRLRTFESRFPSAAAFEAFLESPRRGPGVAGRGARPRGADREVPRGARPPSLAGPRERGPEGLGGGQGRTELGGRPGAAARPDAAGARIRARPGGARTAADLHPGARSSPGRRTWRGSSWVSGRPPGEEAQGQPREGHSSSGR